MKTIKVKATEDGDAFLDLSDFADVVDVSKVVYYSMEEVDDDGKTVLILKFYDKDSNLLNISHNS